MRKVSLCYSINGVTRPQLEQPVRRGGRELLGVIKKRNGLVQLERELTVTNFRGGVGVQDRDALGEDVMGIQDRDALGEYVVGVQDRDALGGVGVQDRDAVGRVCCGSTGSRCCWESSITTGSRLV